jgi:predicted outer membrane repeat protein
MHTTNIVIRLAAVVLCFWIPATAAGKIIHVDHDATGANNGSSWSDAYNHLQDALADAASAAKPVEIRVAGGVYRPDEGAPVTPGNRQATFQLINSVTVKGGYAGLGKPNPDARDVGLYETILSGDLDDNDAGSANKAENSYHVVTGSATDASAVLDGLTIAGGNANGLGTDSSGGGMFNGPGSSPTVTSCVFSRNLAAGHGAGMYNDSTCNPTLTDCTFSNNSAVGYGGGLYIAQAIRR